MSYLDKFFESTLARIVSIVAIIWSAVALGQYAKKRYDERKSNVVDVEPK